MYKLAFVRKNLIILRFDYDSAHVIIWNNYAGKKKNKVLDTIIMPIIQNNFLSEFENDQFLKSICYLSERTVHPGLKLSSF